jgi:large subunit ribosomal protein L25
MPDITLVVEPRTDTGSPAARRYRAQDKIPAIVYGQGVDPVSILVNRRDLRLALSTPAGTNAVIIMSVAGQQRPTVVKQLQRDPVRRTVRHVDFLVVDLDQVIDVEIPLIMVGEAIEVKNAEGIVDSQVPGIMVSTKPGNIPTQLTIDVSDMKIGDTKKASDVALPAGVTLAMDADAVIVSAEATRATVAMQQGGETAAGETAAGDVGDADTSGT